MANYRLYLLTAADRIAGGMVLTCDTDDQALAEMAQHAGVAPGAELWLGAHLVHRMPPRSAATDEFR